MNIFDVTTKTNSTFEEVMEAQKHSHDFFITETDSSKDKFLSVLKINDQLVLNLNEFHQATSIVLTKEDLEKLIKEKSC